MSLLISAIPGLSDRAAAAADPAAETRARLQSLLQRAEPLAEAWAAEYATAWALEEHLRRDARAWSAEAAKETVRHLRAPQASIAGLAVTVLSLASANLVTTLVLLPSVGALAAALLAGPGVLVSVLGMQLAARYVGIVAQHRAGIPPFRAQLQRELERHALAALGRRREQLAGPRRPIPRHAFRDLLPAQAQNIAAAWMRHLGELDATVLKGDDRSDDAALPAQLHLISSGYVGRVWWFSAETPALELRALEKAAKATGKRPILFSLSGFPKPVIARADRRGIGLLTYRPWNGTLVAHGAVGERYLRRGLREAEG